MASILETASLCVPYGWSVVSKSIETNDNAAKIKETYAIFVTKLPKTKL
jgi:hypothetical protein